jgi:hypothetical protein
MDSERKSNVQHVIVPRSYPLLRVAAAQLERLEAPDRAAIRLYVERDMRALNER